jgi:putative flippase GtrA
MQFIKFLIVGGINTSIYYFIYIVFLFIDFDYKIAVMNATVITITISFFTFKKFVFKMKGRFYYFIVLQIANMFINILLITLFRKVLNDYISGLISLIIISLLSFYINRRYIFKGE